MIEVREVILDPGNLPATGSPRNQDGAQPETETEEPRGCCLFGRIIGLVLLHIVGFFCGIPLSILCLIVVICTIILLTLFVTGKMTIYCCGMLCDRDYSGCGESFQDTIMDLKGTLGRFFTACRGVVLKCYSQCVGCDHVTQFFYYVSLYTVLGVVVALSCIMCIIATLICTSFVVAAVGLILGLGLAIIVVYCALNSAAEKLCF